MLGINSFIRIGVRFFEELIKMGKIRHSKHSQDKSEHVTNNPKIVLEQLWTSEQAEYLRFL